MNTGGYLERDSIAVEWGGTQREFLLSSQLWDYAVLREELLMEKLRCNKFHLISNLSCEFYSIFKVDVHVM